MRLKDLPLGTVIEYRGKRYHKLQGQDGDILMAEKDRGTWYFIKGTYKGNYSTVDWKAFHIFYCPGPLREDW